MAVCAGIVLNVNIQCVISVNRGVGKAVGAVGRHGFTKEEERLWYPTILLHP